VADAWATEFVGPEDMRPGCMCLIRTPLTDCPAPPFMMDTTRSEAVMKQLLDDYKITVPVLSGKGYLWVRISAQIYNDMAEYEALRDAIVSIGNSK
jgi:hypothetical protein